MLNKEQKQAAYSTRPAIVTAGPGSGKTKTLIERVAYLLQNKISPTEILCFTFTRSAAKEMKERLSCRFNIRRLTITTIHSFCLNILRKNFHLLGFNEHILTYDDVDSADLMQLIASENNWIYKPKKPTNSPDYSKIIQEYHNRLREYNAVNFDQMQEFAIQLLRDKKLEHIQRRYNYIIIDEMQDISDTDYELITLLAEYHHNIFCVGDIDQCIFEFRGSNPSLLNQLEKFLDNGYHINLNRSYRCPQPTLDLCNKLAGTNLVSETNCSVEPIYEEFDSPEEEADWIIEMIEAYQSEHVGILCRTNRIISFLSTYFDKHTYEHHVVGDKIRLIDDPAVRLVNSFLKFRYNPNDYLNFYRVMPLLHNNIPSREIRRIKSTAVINNASLLEQAEVDYDMSLFRKPESDFITETCDMLSAWHRSKGMTTKADMIDRYKASLDEWFSANPGLGLDDYIFFISDISVTEDSHQEVQQHKVNILTIHASKGLEFDTVFIPQINKHSFRANDRNVLFVAMSRTKKNLFMSYTHYTYLYGTNIVETHPSVFLEDLGLIRSGV